jgi:hypothetical protein
MVCFAALDDTQLDELLRETFEASVLALSNAGRPRHL